jgi:catechol 2,3-dioxygenase-like lactoylglutathione lyase family enzyme
MVAKRVVPGPWVGSTAVVVSDRPASLRWYTEKLGMTVLIDGEHWVTVGCKGIGGTLHLCQGTDLGEGFPLEPGNSGILLLMEGDFRKNCKMLRDRGVEFSRPPEKRPWGWDAEIRDPDGNLLLLMPDD